MYNPIVAAFGSLVRGPSLRPLIISSFASPNSSGRETELGALLGYRDGQGRFVTMAEYKLASDEESHFAEWVEGARVWLDSLTQPVTA
jgi:hypothetical protein